ncbi:MAG: hypothetical protein ABR915_03660 [Thermoguttaceae bacterium]|jgi:hypothetical protein
MTAEKVREYLRRQPFEPFRVYMSDGSSYEIRHPEFAGLSRRELWVAVPRADEEIPRRGVVCDLLHLTRIEVVGREKPKQRRGRSNGH